MKEIDVISFVDVEAKYEGVAIIRAKKGCVSLCLSLIEDGDIEIFLAPEDAERVIAALKVALLATQAEE